MVLWYGSMVLWRVGGTVTPGVICDCLLRQPIDTQYNIYTKSSTNNNHQLEHSSIVPSQVLQIHTHTHTQLKREKPHSLQLSNQLSVTSLVKHFLVTSPPL